MSPRVDPDNNSFCAGGQCVNLRGRQEFAVLSALLRHESRCVSYRALERAMLGTGAPRFVLRVVVSHLRRRLAEGGLPPMIGTVHRIGYILRVPTESALSGPGRSSRRGRHSEERQAAN